jgi:hypothetical protein
MRLPRSPLVLVLAVAVAAATQAAPSRKDPTPKQGPKPKENPKPKKDHHPRKDPPPNHRVGKGHPAKKERFNGMIARHNATTIEVKHANGTGEGFVITGARTVGKGKGAGQTQFRKGQLVDVFFVKEKGGKRKALEVVITAPPNGPDFEKAKGPPFVGVATKVVSDKYGDTGKLWVKGDRDKVVEFRVTNATYIYYKEGNKLIDHTLQAVAKGQQVHVRHHKHDAVRVDVIK